MRREPGHATGRGTARAAALASLLTLTAGLADALPAPGRYEAILCVRNAGAAPNCGPADFRVHAGGEVVLQVSDIVYRLLVRGSQAAVVVTQGTVQIDEWDGAAESSDSSLHFVDDEKRLSYEVQIGAPRRVAR
jgi:hypothetical protein